MNQPAVHRRRRANVIASVVQVLVSGLVLFVLFRYLYDQLGIEQIGVWSLVLATTSVSRIGELGLSAGVIRFVAQALGRGDEVRAAEVIQTVIITLGLFMAVVLLAVYPVAVVVIRKVVPAEAMALAVEILPYALVSLWLNIAASVFSGGLDGCMRIDLRCIATASLHVAFLALVVFLTPTYGLRGVAIAQILQALGLLLATWWLIRRELRALPIFPFRWSKTLLSEMIGYGLSFQVISVMSMLLDPVAKALLKQVRRPGRARFL